LSETFGNFFLLFKKNRCKVSVEIRVTEKIYYKNQSAADEMIKQNTLNSATTSHYYHLAISVNVNKA